MLPNVFMIPLIFYKWSLIALHSFDLGPFHHPSPGEAKVNSDPSSGAATLVIRPMGPMPKDHLSSRIAVQGEKLEYILRGLHQGGNFSHYPSPFITSSSMFLNSSSPGCPGEIMVGKNEFASRCFPRSA